MTPERELAALRQQVARLIVENEQKEQQLKTVISHSRKWEARAKKHRERIDALKQLVNEELGKEQIKNEHE